VFGNINEAADLFLREAIRLKPLIEESGTWIGDTPDPDVEVHLSIMDDIYEFGISLPLKATNAEAAFLIFDNAEANTYPSAGGFLQEFENNHRRKRVFEVEISKQLVKDRCLLMLAAFEMGSAHKKVFLNLGDFIHLTDFDRDKYSGRIPWDWSSTPD